MRGEGWGGGVRDECSKYDLWPLTDLTAVRLALRGLQDKSGDMGFVNGQYKMKKEHAKQR